MNFARKAGSGALVCAALAAAAFSPAQTNPPAGGAPRFVYGGDAAELTAQFSDHLVFLSAHVNESKPSLFLLDTTSATTSIAPGRAAAIDRVNAPSPVLNFDGVNLPFFVLPQVDRPAFGALVGQAYQGTLGLDFLSRFVVEIDYSRQTVRVFAPGSYKYSGPGTVLPLRAGSGAPVIPLRFALEKGKEVEADFLVDTALDASVLIENKFLAAHHKLGDRGKTIPAVDPLTGAAGAQMGKPHLIELAKRSPEDVLAVFSDQVLPDAGVPVAGAIGVGLLRRFNAVFDLPHHQLILEANSHFGDPDEEDKSGLAILARGQNYKTFDVVNVMPGTPAAEAGIQKGDVIAGVDADPAADLDLLFVRHLFCQVGHKYKLTMQRGDATREVTLQMRRYF